MVQLFSHIKSPRLQYAAEIIFGTILGVPYQIIHEEEDISKDQALVIYGAEDPGNGLTIPTEGLLAETFVRDHRPDIHVEAFPKLFYKPSSGKFALDFDLFAAAFYLATEYEKYIHPIFDEYGRYKAGAYREEQLGLFEKPLVHRYAFLLWEKLKEIYPVLQKHKLPAYDFEITMDLDAPWKYLNKPLYIQIGGFAKDIFQGNWSQLAERYQTFVSRKDPYDTLELFNEHVNRKKRRIFFLLERKSNEDSRFTWRSPALRRLIQTLYKAGHQVGIHPSFESFLDAQQISFEKGQLEKLTAPLDSSRQHFLKYRYPHTFRYLLEAGVRHEYSLCLFQCGGFPAGMARPFRWYDLENEAITDLFLHPTILMDRSLMQYASMSPEAALEYAEQLVLMCKQFHGHFTMLLHNDALSESEEWKGWRHAMLVTLKSISS